MERKKPYTNAELFRVITGILKDNGEMPDILDYSLEERDMEEIRTYEFDFSNNLSYGGSEGIYLDVGIRGREGEVRLGTFKTLMEDKDAMRTMGILLADFIREGRDFVNKNLDDFTWSGYSVRGFMEDGSKFPYSYDTRTAEQAEEKAAEFFKKGAAECEIFNYQTRKSRRIEHRD